MSSNKDYGVTKGNITALIAIYLVYGLAQASNEFRILFLKNQGLTATECGRVLAAASLLCVFAGPIASALADKLRSRRIVYMISSSLWIISVIGLLFLGKYKVAGFVLCAGFIPLISVFDPITYNMIEASGVNASMKVEKLDFSIIRVCLSIGYCLINFAYTPLVVRFGPAFPFACTGVFVIILLILSPSLRVFETETASRSGAEKKKLEPGRLFKSYYLVTFLALCFIQALGSCSGSFLIYLMDEIGMDQALVGTASGIRVVGEIILLLLMPFIKKKLSLPFLQAVAICMSLIQLVLCLTAKSPAQVFAALAVGGSSVGIMLGSRALYLRALAPEGLDTLTITLYSTMFSVGNIVMNFFSGSIVDRSGVHALYRLSIVFYLIWMVVFFGSWIIGKYVLKKEPVIPLFSPWRRR